MKKRIKRISLRSLACDYYEEYSDTHRRRLFRKDLEHKFGHHLSLKDKLRRKGWYKSKKLPPVMVEEIKGRLGEP